MLFRRQKTTQIESGIANAGQATNNSYWAGVRRQFYKNRLAVWSLRFFGLILFIAAFADI